MSRLLAIQGLRAIAAGMVVYAHGLMTYQDKIDTSAEPNTLMSYGDLGVKIFFCISGLIIFKSTLSMPPGADSVWTFIKKRLIRIVPAYWIATLVYAAKLSMQGTAVSLEHLIKSLLFIPYVDAHGLMRPVLGAGWTLNYEMLFYSVMALCLMWGLAWRYVMAGVTITLLLTSGALGWLPASPGDIGHELSLLSEPILLYFLVGMLIGHVSAKPMAKRIALPWHVGLAGSCVVLAALIGFVYLTAPTAVVLSTCEFVVCGLAVWLAANAKHTEGQTDTFLSRSIVNWGDGSYSTYLTHGFIMGPAARVLSISNIPLGGLAFALLMIALCTWVGEHIHRRLEQPMIAKLNKWAL